MALATYSDLSTQIANWIARADLSANIPDFITLFEAYAARRMRLRPAETTATLTTVSGSVALPTDYLAYRSLTWAGSTRLNLSYVHPDQLENLFPSNPAGVPSVFSIVGANIKVRPYDDTASVMSFDYFAKNAALSSALNWLYTSHPDAYLTGSLAEAYGFMKNYDEADKWGSRRDAIFDEIRLAVFREPGGLAQRAVGQTP